MSSEKIRISYGKIDKNGNIVKELKSRYKEIAYSYDGFYDNGQPKSISEIDSSISDSITYTYDEDGNVTDIYSSEGRVTQDEYCDEPHTRNWDEADGMFFDEEIHLPLDLYNLFLPLSEKELEFRQCIEEEDLKSFIQSHLCKRIYANVSDDETEVVILELDNNGKETGKLLAHYIDKCEKLENNKEIITITNIFAGVTIQIEQEKDERGIVIQREAYLMRSLCEECDHILMNSVQSEHDEHGNIIRRIEKDYETQRYFEFVNNIKYL